MMRRMFILAAVAALFCFVVSGTAMSQDAAGKKSAGEKEFMEHCAVCHPDGGNIINSAKSLRKKDLDANGVKTSADIVKLIRNPNAGMTKFGKKTISDKNAKAIAEYILMTFK